MTNQVASESTVVNLDELEAGLLEVIAKCEQAGPDSVFAHAIICSNRQTIALIQELRAYREREASDTYAEGYERALEDMLRDMAEALMTAIPRNSQDGAR